MFTLTFVSLCKDLPLSGFGSECGSEYGFLFELYCKRLVGTTDSKRGSGRLSFFFY